MKGKPMIWNQEMDEHLRTMAPDPAVSRFVLATLLGVSEGAIRNREKALGVAWHQQSMAGELNPMYGESRPDFRANHWTKTGYDQSGARNPGWKGGVSYHPKYGFRGTEWPKIRRCVLKRDGNECRYCSKEEGLAVHHIIPFVYSRDNSMDNLVTLCLSCHKRTDHRTRKLFEIAIKRGDLVKCGDIYVTPQWSARLA